MGENNSKKYFLTYNLYNILKNNYAVFLSEWHSKTFFNFWRTCTVQKWSFEHLSRLFQQIDVILYKQTHKKNLNGKHKNNKYNIKTCLEILHSRANSSVLPVQSYPKSVSGKLEYNRPADQTENLNSFNINMKTWNTSHRY